MKKLICAALALCILISNLALAEEYVLPVLTAQLGTEAQLVEKDEQGDEYMEVLTVGTAVVIMGRYAGEKTAEELALMFEEDLRDGEMLADGEGGIDERAVFLAGEGEQTQALDATVIRMDGYTYGFVVVVSENAYFGYTDDEPFSDQVDFWVETLDVFDGELAADADSGVSVMLLFDHPLYNDAALVTSETYDETSYSMELISADGMVSIYEYTLPDLGMVYDLEGELLAIAQRMQPEAAAVEWYQDDELTAQLGGYPVYIALWMAAGRECSAMVVMGPQTLVLGTAVDSAHASGYEQPIAELYASSDIYAIDSAVDISGVQAEEIGYAIFGDYAEFVYVWDETIGDLDYCIYEFIDEDGLPIGVIAVQPDTGEALASLGTDALTPIYEPVYYSAPLGYHLAPSVGWLRHMRSAVAV